MAKQKDDVLRRIAPNRYVELRKGAKWRKAQISQ